MVERRERVADQRPVPPRAVLVEQQHGLAVPADARPRARRLILHECEQAMHLGLARGEAESMRPSRIASSMRSPRTQSRPDVAAYPSLKMR